MLAATSLVLGLAPLARAQWVTVPAPKVPQPLLAAPPPMLVANLPVASPVPAPASIERFYFLDGARSESAAPAPPASSTQRQSQPVTPGRTRVIVREYHYFAPAANPDEKHSKDTAPPGRMPLRIPSAKEAIGEKANPPSTKESTGEPKPLESH